MGTFGPELLSTRTQVFRVVLARPTLRFRNGTRPRFHPVEHSDLQSTRCPSVIVVKQSISRIYPVLMCTPSSDKRLISVFPWRLPRDGPFLDDVIG